MQALLEFIQKYYDKQNVGDTPENTGQCVGVIEVWLDNLNLNTPHLFGNAKDLLTDADTSKFDVIQNTPDNFPLSGDIMVFGETYGGGVGHTGIVVAADSNTFSLFQQNDPTGSKPSIKTYNYTGVLGWLHPKVSVAPQDGLQQELDQCRAERDKNWNLYQADETTISNLNQIINDRNNDITQLNATTMTLKTQLTSSQQEVDTLKPIAASVPDLKKQLEQALSDRTVCLQAEAKQQEKITNLEVQLAEGKPKGFFAKLIFLFK